MMHCRIFERIRTQNHYHKLLGGIFLILPVVCVSIATTLCAKDGDIGVIGKVYDFGGNNPYMISKAEDYRKSDDAKTYGAFYINGEITDTSEKDGIPSFEVDGNKLVFSYIYDDALLKGKKDKWHLCEDDCDTIDGLKLGDDIDKGAIVIQTSRDGEKWVANKVFTDEFKEIPVQVEPFYTTPQIMLENGSYFRVTIAYETRKLIEKTAGILFLPGKEKYEYKRHAEVYEFYAYDKNSAESIENGERHYFDIYSSTVNTGNNNGYSGKKEITSGDPHYGWKLGDFFVSGYSAKKEKDGTQVFLKNVGDKVTLWFNLEQDIDKLNGKDTWNICRDDGFDQAFGTKKTDFGRGTIIIRYTDFENKKKDIIYTNYLEAYASTGADTKVSLFEEGDYEVALDYEIEREATNPFDPPAYDDYRANFKFSIRNGNCMVYPIDVVTGNELTNTSITENGFRLDLAKSRYLDLSIKKENLAPGADGLVEDTRINEITKDGQEFTEEGIYTISVHNEYTGQNTQKVIYVGTNDILKAAVVNGMTVEQVNDQLEYGAEIQEDGTLKVDGRPIA